MMVHVIVPTDQVWKMGKQDVKCQSPLLNAATKQNSVPL